MSGLTGWQQQWEAVYMAGYELGVLAGIVVAVGAVNCENALRCWNEGSGL